MRQSVIDQSQGLSRTTLWSLETGRRAEMLTKSELKTKTEKYPLPTTVDGICSLVREILAAGRVQRLEIDVSQPVRVTRALASQEVGLEEPSLDLEGALRNVS